MNKQQIVIPNKSIVEDEIKEKNIDNDFFISLLFNHKKYLFDHHFCTYLTFLYLYIFLPIENSFFLINIETLHFNIIRF